jgi:hypothetical protein
MPSGVSLLACLRERRRERDLPVLGARSAPSRGGLHIEVMGELHGALGVSRGEVQERPEAIAWVPLARGEACGDELLQLVNRQLGQRHGRSLSEERVTAVSEGVTHQTGMRA